MIKFQYNKKMDQRCWQRVIDAGTIFGTKAPKFSNINDNKVKQAIAKAKIFQKEFDSTEKKFRESIKKIFGKPFPENMNVFINTTPYSMDDYEKKMHLYFI